VARLEKHAGVAAGTGWTAWLDTPEEIVGIESYAGMDARYYQPTLAEFRRSLGAESQELECAFSHNELGERCPTLVLARRT